MVNNMVKSLKGVLGLHKNNFHMVLILATAAAISMAFTLAYVYKIGIVAPEPMPSTGGDNWTFLPKYEPGKNEPPSDTSNATGDDVTKDTRFIERVVLSCYSELGLELTKNDEGFGKDSINKSRVDGGIYGSDWCLGYTNTKIAVKISLHKNQSIAQKETDKQLAFYSGTVPWNGEGSNYKYYSSSATVREAYEADYRAKGLDPMKLPDNEFVTSVMDILYGFRTGKCSVIVYWLTIGKIEIGDVRHGDQEEAKQAGIKWIGEKMAPSVVQIGEHLQNNNKLRIFCS